jgi:hypothetical protein
MGKSASGVFPRRGIMSPTRRRRGLAFSAFFSMMIAAGVCWSDERNPPGHRFSLKLTGGARYVFVGDLNRHLDSFNSLPSAGGEISRIDNWSSDWEVEVRLDLSSKVGLGLACSGFFNKSNQSSLFVFGAEYSIPEVVLRDTQYTFRPEVKSAMPLGLNLYYSVRRSAELHLFVSLGAGWYTGKMTENLASYHFHTDGATYFIVRHWSADNNLSLGVQGGLGLEYGIRDGLALVAELQGRYARIGSLKGTRTDMSNWSFREENGTLFYYRTTMGELGPWYTELAVSKSPPEVGFVPFKDTREAVLDLSGYSLRVGLRVALF